MIRLNGTMRCSEEGILEIGGVDVLRLRAEFGTPLVVIDEQLVRATCREYRTCFERAPGGGMVLYASKAFLTPALCRIMESEGLGLDVVSGGELYIAREAGFPMDRVVFHGNNKSAEELEMALDLGIGRIVVDNGSEMTMLSRLAQDRDRPTDVFLRVTPGVEAHTHEYIRTGQIDSKFGFTLSDGSALQAARDASGDPFLNLCGFHCHIGSQIFAMDSYRHAARIMCRFIRDVQEACGATVAELDLGGGFGIYYSDGDTPTTIQEYADAVVIAVLEEAALLGIPVPRILVEPGRSIIGPAGTSLYTVGTIKEIPEHRKYVALDGGMTDNIRPALYGARYEALLANRAGEVPSETVTLAGKCCESGDVLLRDVLLPPAKPGDLVAMTSTGAYGYAMASNYNALPRPAVVLVCDGDADLIVSRESYGDLVRNARIPERIRGCS